MIDQDQLYRRALRAYELGRLRMSSRVLLFLVPLAIVCTALSSNRVVCAVVALLTVTVAVLLRWFDRRGVQAVDTGLKSGVVPLLVSVALMQAGCSGNAALCTTICIVAGTLAGSWTGFQLARGRAGPFVWLSSLAVAMLVAALGSLDLGLVASAALAAAYVASGAIVGTLVYISTGRSRRPATFPRDCQ